MTYTDPDVTTDVTDKWVVIWFPPEGDSQRTFRSEAKAREFAARSDTDANPADWNPILERRRTIVETEQVAL